MENNNWADEKLSALAPDWQPNVGRGLARFNELRGISSRRIRLWTWAATATAAAAIGIAAFPAPRAAAQKICETCEGFIFRQVAYRENRKPAPNFALADGAGNKVRLSDFRGKVVVLDFWATWCRGCKEEIPWFIEFQERYGPSGLAVIGASMDDDGWKSVRPFVEESRINYTVVLGNDALAKAYGLDPMPMTVLIDKHGRIASVHVGIVDKAGFEKELQALLEQRKS